MKRIALTGGIACGKSLVAKFLNELGVETIDADDIVHTLIPDAAERKRLAAQVFKDAAARKALEARLHPIVKERINAFLSAPCERGDFLRLAIIPLLFESHWNEEYDIICTVTSSRAMQIERMMTRRGYTREEAEARIAAQMDVSQKAEKSNYVIANDGSADDLKREVAAFVTWLRNNPQQ